MTATGTFCKTYEQALAVLAGRTRRKVANNTYLEVLDGGSVGRIGLKLHNTYIIEYFSDGTTILTSGGWRTVTTKARLNDYSDAGISQRRGVWYMADGSLFYDGIQLRGGEVVTPRETTDYEAKLRVIKRQAKVYARDYVEALRSGHIDYPSGGDCWYCSLFTASENTTHLVDHMAEKYYVPSLLVNAGREAGYRDEQIGLMGIGGQRVFIDPERVIYNYLVKHLQKGL